MSENNEATLLVQGKRPISDHLSALYNTAARIFNPYKKSNLYKHAKRELELANMISYKGFKADPYNEMVSKNVLKLIKVFSSAGHSGFSAEMTLAIFNRVAKFGTLSVLEPTLEEAHNVDGKDLFQSSRHPSVFSDDGGKTWYNIDDGDWKYPETGKSLNERILAKRKNKTKKNKSVAKKNKKV